MARQSNIDFVPSIDAQLIQTLRNPDSWVLDLASEPVNQFNLWMLGLVTEHIEKLNETLGQMPQVYEWRYMTAEAFKECAEQMTPKDSHIFFYEDMLGQIEAYSFMSAWRLAEIARSAVLAAMRGDVLCAAVMARAALETAASYSWLHNDIRRDLTRVGQGDTPIHLENLEEILLKVVFASKLEDAEEFYKPTNIITIIERMTKRVPGHQGLKDVYALLCEVAHPNLLGRSIYETASGESSDVMGYFKVEFSMNYKRSSKTAAFILRNAISVLSWSCVTFSLSYVSLLEGVCDMRGHLSRIADRRQ